MRKTFQYRIYPSKTVERELKRTLKTCQVTYNRILDTRISAYKENGSTVSKYDVNKRLTDWKKDDPHLQNVHSQLVQDVSDRVDKAYRNFFRRVKEGGDKAGFPRFKSEKRYDSFTFPQNNGGFRLNKAKTHLRLSKIGTVKIKYHRPIVGEVKTCNIRRDASGNWWASFSVEYERKHYTPPTNMKAVGIDVGLKTFATLSNGDTIEKPHHFKRDAGDLARAQRNEKPYRAKIHKRISNRRKDFLHKVSRSLVDSYHFIAIEDTNVKKMVEHNFSNVNCKIADYAWSAFADMLSYKAEEAGRCCVRVNPAYTSQTCSKCGNVREGDQALTLKDRTYDCAKCGHSEDRDVNAAKNILAVGLHGFARASAS